MIGSLPPIDLDHGFSSERYLGDIMSIEQILLIIVVVGLVGSSIEKIGMTIGSPKTEAVGKAIESVASDLPKFVTNIVSIFSKSAVK
jgi:hypothetical protein